MPPPVIYSFIYFAVFIIYPLLGVYVLSLNVKATMNRLFFLLCLSLAAWAITFALGIAAPDYETSLFWRRVSSLGWGSMYGILFHFFLYLTKKEQLSDKKWIYSLIYLPVLVNIFVYGLYSPLANQQYELVFTSLGWVNLSPGGGWDWFFNFYYGIFTLGALWLLISWALSSKEADIKKTALILGCSMFLTILVGTMTDIVNNSFVAMPDIGVIIAVIPFLALLYTIKKHGFLSQERYNRDVEEGVILSESKRREFFRLISFSFIIVSLLNLVHYFYFPVELNEVLLFSALMFWIGILFRLIMFTARSTRQQDYLMITLLAISIPIIMIHFLESPAGNNVWPFPLVFICLAAIYNNKKMIIVIFAAALLTQLWIWNQLPSFTVQVDSIDHLLRIVIFIIGASLALYINQTYVSRLKENEEQITFQKLCARISTDFISVDESNIESRINQMLKLCGQYFQAGRTYLLLMSEDKKFINYSYEWCDEGVAPAINEIGRIQVNDIQWGLDRLKDLHILYLPDVDLLPQEAAAEKSLFEKLDVKSFIAVPLIGKGSIMGIWGFDAVSKANHWVDEHREQIAVLANLLADALVKVETEKEIQKMAYYDELTGLPNRSLFNDRLEKAIPLARRSEKYIGVMFIDLDSFKHVNDTMGHKRGDLLLQLVAERITGNLYQSDTVCRFGGDEFLIMFPQMDNPAEVEQAANKIMTSFDKPIELNGQEIFITASGGVTLYPTDGEGGETLIKNADLAMYYAKSRGRNQYAFCSTLMKESVQKSTLLTNQLYRALEREELVLHYQPQVAIPSNEIIGLEALIRWQHPEKGLIGPLEFIPQAEKTGLINPIGCWVLQSACSYSKKLQDLGLARLKMSVNISVEQLKKPGFVEIVKNVLDETGLEPFLLDLEITESAIIRGTNYMLQVLNELKALGVSISIDDFGTEYSSLSRLKEMPIDRLKIDMQFIQGISHNKKDEAITAVIVSLGRSLGMKVIAEGVETNNQLSFLNQRMCDEVQGFYFYKPMPAPELEKLLRNFARG